MKEINLKVGDILNFAYADTLFSKLIRFRNRFYYNSPYTHSAIITNVEDGIIEVAEAINKGFTISDYSYNWLSDRIHNGTIIVGRTSKELSNIRENATKYSGIRYGWGAIFFISLSLLSRQSIKWSDGVKSLICSEAVSRILYDSSNKKINFELEFNKPYDEITPDDLANSKQIRWYNDIK
jgi:hypothetical protein